MNKIKYLTRIRDSYEERAAKLLTLRRNMDIFASGKKIYSELINLYPSCAPMLVKICEAIPSEKITLSALNFSRPAPGSSEMQITLSGKILGQDVGGSEITSFVSSLEKSGYFKNLALSIQKSPASDMESPIGTSSQSKELTFIINGSVKIK